MCLPGSRGWTDHRMLLLLMAAPVVGKPYQAAQVLLAVAAVKWGQQQVLGLLLPMALQDAAWGSLTERLRRRRRQLCATPLR